MKTKTTSATISDHDISIWIDTYDDLFSDFDPRNYNERNISDDFLQEIRKVAREKTVSVKHLRLLTPEKVRDADCELTISRRLRHHFQDGFRHNEAKRKSFRRKSVLFLLIGMLLILAAGYFSFLKTEYPLMHIPFVILEPAGWFITWTGFEHIVRASNKQMPELVFYTKLHESKIVFENIK